MILNPLLEAALDYARRGWRVIPLHNLVGDGSCSCDGWRAERQLERCPTPAKHPRFSKWADQSSTDPEQIRKWWKAWPKANVGVVTGKASGQIVLDTDPRNGGDWSRAELIAKHEGGLGDCPTALTGSKGLHEHFAWPEGLETTHGKLEIADGLEVLIHNCNCVMPPSYAHRTGDEYAWDVEPGETLPPAPAWLVDIIKAKLQPEDGAGARKPGQGGAPWPKTDIGPILRGCGWMQHCAEHGASLTEPQWYAQLSIVGRCENGEALAHEFSSSYQGYTERETAAKLQQALRAAGPATCAKIRHSLGGDRFCAECPSWSHIKSPISLGMPKAGKRPPDPPPPSDEDAPAAAGELVAGETFSLLQLVERVIAANDIDQVFSPELVAALAVANATDRGKALAKLTGHFDGRKVAGVFRDRLSARNLNKAIAEARSRTGQVRVLRSGDDRPPWQSLLLRNGNGAPRGNLANAITALRHAEEWDGVLWRDEFREATWARKKPPIDLPAGEWTNLHDTRTAAWLQHRDIEVSREITGLAVESVAHERRFHPVREYLKALKWDGEPRIDRWLRVLAGAKDVEDKPIQGQTYLAAIGSRWLISAVARVMRPGCKADCALVLEGPQGARKSSLLKALFGEEWFTDQLEEMGNKDSSMQTHGVWGIEIAELGSMTKAEVEQVKAFMSRQVERYRPPYAGRLINVPRQCVFAGTTNLGSYLRDETGARRFWPVQCGAIDLDSVVRFRDQLWAEAYLEFGKGTPWWLDAKETVRTAEEEQAVRYREDPWEDRVAAFVRYLDEVTIAAVMDSSECLDIQVSRRTQADANRVAAILQRLGWRKARKRVGNERSNVYRPATDAARLAGAKQEALPV